MFDRKAVPAWVDDWYATPMSWDDYKALTRDTGLPDEWENFITDPNISYNGDIRQAFADYVQVKHSKLYKVLK